MNPKVYIISGTLGAGKSAVSKLLAAQLKDSILISGDTFMHMFQNDQNPNWENKLKFIWDNVIHTARGALDLNLEVVIDGVVEDELPFLKKSFAGYEINYHILIADEEILKTRIHKRGTPEMIQRSMDVLAHIQSDPEKAAFIIDTSQLTPEQVCDLILPKK